MRIKCNPKDLLNEYPDTMGGMMFEMPPKNDETLDIRLISKKDGKFYEVFSDEVEEITEDMAKRLAFKFGIYKRAVKKGWWTEEYDDYKKRIGI